MNDVAVPLDGPGGADYNTQWDTAPMTSGTAPSKVQAFGEVLLLDYGGTIWTYDTASKEAYRALGYARMPSYQLPANDDSYMNATVRTWVSYSVESNERHYILSTTTEQLRAREGPVVLYPKNKNYMDNSGNVPIVPQNPSSTRSTRLFVKSNMYYIGGGAGSLPSKLCWILGVISWNTLKGGNVQCGELPGLTNTTAYVFEEAQRGADEMHLVDKETGLLALQANIESYLQRYDSKLRLIYAD